VKATDEPEDLLKVRIIEELKDRRDLRQSLIHRLAWSKDQSRKALIDAAIKTVELQIKSLSHGLQHA
jgi:hypothetical protein